MRAFRGIQPSDQRKDHVLNQLKEKKTCNQSQYYGFYHPWIPVLIFDNCNAPKRDILLRNWGRIYPAYPAFKILSYPAN